MTMNTRIKSNKTTDGNKSKDGAKGATKIVNKDYVQRTLKEVPRSRIEVVFSEVQIHPDATLRGDRDVALGFVKEQSDRIYDALDDGNVTVETLVNHPNGKMTVAKLTDKDNMIVWHDGHTRASAIRRYKGETYADTVDLIEITESELRLFAPSVNAGHGTNYTVKEVKAAITRMFETDQRFVHFSDEAISSLMGGGYVARNVANLRRGIAIAKTLEMVRKGYDLKGYLTAMIKKYMPEIRYGVDGVEKNISGQQKTLFDSMYADDAFQGHRPEDKEAAKAEPAKAAKAEPAKAESQPAASEQTDDQPATVEPATVEPATVEPTDDQPATVEPTADDQPATVEPGTLYAFNGVEFTVKSGKVAIVSNGLIDIAAILAFADAYRQDQQSQQLFDVETVEVA